MTGDGVVSVTATRVQFVEALQGLYPLATLDEVGDLAEAIMSRLPEVPHRCSHKTPLGAVGQPESCVCGKEYTGPGALAPEPEAVAVATAALMAGDWTPGPYEAAQRFSAALGDVLGVAATGDLDADVQLAAGRLAAAEARVRELTGPLPGDPGAEL